MRPASSFLFIQLSNARFYTNCYFTHSCLLFYPESAIMSLISIYHAFEIYDSIQCKCLLNAKEEET